MFCATVALTPATRDSSGAEAVFRSTPTPVDTAFHHAVQRLRQPVLGHIVLILPHADGLGSILTSSAKGSCSRRAMETADRRLTS